MDSQTIINTVIGIAGFLGGYILNRMTNAIDRLDGDVRKIQVNYIEKDTYYRDIREIKDMLKLIFDRLEHKQDKHP